MNQVLIASRDSRFGILLVHCFGPAEGCRNMACVKSFDALAKNFMGVAYSGNHKGGKKCVDNGGGLGGGGSILYRMYPCYV